VSQIGEATGTQSAGTAAETPRDPSKTSIRATGTASKAISTITTGPEASSSDSSTMPPSSFSSTKLSAGAIAGIVIGAVIAVVLMMLLALLCYRHGQEQAMKTQGEVNHPQLYSSAAVSSSKVQEQNSTVAPPQQSEPPDQDHQDPPEIDSRVGVDGRAELEHKIHRKKPSDAPE